MTDTPEQALRRGDRHSKGTDDLLVQAGLTKERLDEVLPLVERELRRVAGNLLKRERADHSLRPTEVVSELYIRLAEQANLKWDTRDDFLGIAAYVMRQFLVDYSRRRKAIKRGKGERASELDEGVHTRGEQLSFEDVLALGRALDTLEVVEPRQARIVELRLFAGFTTDETADFLHLSRSTVERDYRSAKMLLKESLSRGAPRAPES